MLYDALRTQINTYLAGEQLSWKMMAIHVNWVVDQINEYLNACFPQFEDTPKDDDDNVRTYTAIPDLYIRTVIVPGAAHHFFMIDDEGATAEQDFNFLYQQGLFNMLRDYSHSIPDEYQADKDNGQVESTYEDSWGLRGIWI